jgi:hypothetical protein
MRLTQCYPALLYLCAPHLLSWAAKEQSEVQQAVIKQRIRAHVEHAPHLAGLACCQHQQITRQLTDLA